LSNRTLLVNNLFDLVLYAGNRVVSAVGMKPPHDVQVTELKIATAPIFSSPNYRAADIVIIVSAFFS
jgi:hypothetical protein